MIFYVAVDDNGHTKLFTRKDEAGKVNKQFEQLDIPTNSAGLQDFVQQLLTKIDSLEEVLKSYRALYPITIEQVMPSGEAGGPVLATEGSIPSPPPPVAPVAPITAESYTAQSIRLEDQWEKLPVVMKLHFAAVAMEEFRTIAGLTRQEDS